MNRYGLSLMVLGFLLIDVQPAHAYLDPGAGSMLAQVVLGGSAAVLVLFKLGWRRVAAWLQPARAEEPCPPAERTR